MSNQAKHIDILKKLQEKYDAQSEDTENYLEGLLRQVLDLLGLHSHRRTIKFTDSTDNISR